MPTPKSFYHNGRTAYSERDCPSAIAYFEAAKRIQPIDQAVNIHLQRARNCQQTPPPDSWDGV